MLSRTAEYAIRAVACLAQRPDVSLTTQQVSKLTQVPPGYLAKVLQALHKAGLVTAARGIHGGYSLRVSPAELTLLRVVDAIDPMRRIEQCPLGLVHTGHKLCPLHKRLDQVIELTRRALEETSVAQVLRESVATSPLCEEPEHPPVQTARSLATTLNNSGSRRRGRRPAEPIPSLGDAI